jgi:hypothetical protein
MAKPIDLSGYLRRKGSPLADYVPDIVRSANRYRIDPRLLVAISGAETSFATNGRGPKVYNAWGIGPGRAYGSWEEGIDATAKLLRQSYVGQGLRSVPAIQTKWAPIGAGNDPRNMNSVWRRNVGQFYTDLGGNPQNVTLGWRNAASPEKLGRIPPKTPGGDVLAPYTPQSDLLAGAAIENLRAISRGEDATKTLTSLIDASIQQTAVNAAALRTLDQPPVPEKNRSPDGGAYSYTRTKEQAPNPRVQSAVEIALRQIGKPYVWGTEGPKSFDCSRPTRPRSSGARSRAARCSPATGSSRTRASTWSCTSAGARSWPHRARGRTSRCRSWPTTSAGSWTYAASPERRRAGFPAPRCPQPYCLAPSRPCSRRTRPATG